MMSWASQKQPNVSMSPAKAEYVAATTSACHAVWLKRLLKDMGHTQKDPTSILCDNSSAIQLSKHNVFHRKNKHIETHYHVFHRKSKHIDTSYHFIHELVNDGQISLLFCCSKEHLSHLFTKPLGTTTFEHQRERWVEICNLND